MFGWCQSVFGGEEVRIFPQSDSLLRHLAVNLHQLEHLGSSIWCEVYELSHAQAMGCFALLSSQEGSLAFTDMPEILFWVRAFRFY